MYVLKSDDFKVLFLKKSCSSAERAKLVKTALKISFYIHARENKSLAANLGHFGAFSYAFKNLL